MGDDPLTLDLVAEVVADVGRVDVGEERSPRLVDGSGRHGVVGLALDGGHAASIEHRGLAVTSGLEPVRRTGKIDM